MREVNVLVTGKRDVSRLPAYDATSDCRLNWETVPVLEYERLPVDATVLQKLCENPVDWIVFASPRAIRFFSELLLENSLEFPLETQVACVGEETANAAAQDGFNADFYPTEPGSEAFFAEFESMIVNNPAKPSVFLPTAEGGRTYIADKLRDLGCTVTSIPVYRSVRKENPVTPRHTMDAYDALVVTSPSSYDAFISQQTIDPKTALIAIGSFTAEHIRAHSSRPFAVLPDGDFNRILEVL